jgi:hypothetical protein
MAITQNPLIGRTKGTFAGAVFAKYYDKNIIRSKPVQIRDPKSEAQVSQRSKFKIAQQWVIMFLVVIRSGFASYAQNMSAYASALGWYMKNAVTGTPGNYSIDYSAAQFTFGTIAPAILANFSNLDRGDTGVIFTDNSDESNANSSDTVTLILYSPSSNNYVVTTPGNNRGDEYVNYGGTLFEVGETLHAWLFFTNQTTGEMSNSVYAGSGTIV